MPHGVLRPGSKKVAGIVTDDVYAELEAFRRENGLPNMCQTVMAALEQWRARRRDGVQNPRHPPRDHRDSEAASGVQNPSETSAEGS